MTHTVINLNDRLGEITEKWSPRTVAQMNDVDLKVARVQGEYHWHSHPDGDQVFMVLQGTLGMEFRDGVAMLGEGELLVIPRTVEHRPFAESEWHVLLLDPVGW